MTTLWFDKDCGVNYKPISTSKWSMRGGDGDEAVAVASKLQPTIVVMDINMSKMDGITTTRLIKLQYEDTPASAESHAGLEKSENLNPKDMSSVEESKEATERKSSSEN